MVLFQISLQHRTFISVKHVATKTNTLFLYLRHFCISCAKMSGDSDNKEKVEIKKDGEF